MGKLLLVSTPIGNLGDITLRAIKTLKSVDLILCEDTRRTGKLLERIRGLEIRGLEIRELEEKQISKLGVSELDKKKLPLLSFHEHNEVRRIPQIIEKLKAGQNIALVSDAGTPTISDPGFKLVRECIKQKIEVEAIPGASAILTALVVSGLPTDKFLFLGYLPRKTTKRKKLLKSLITINQFIEITIIFFESPYRLVKSLKDILEILGDIEFVICRELTKLYKEVRREKVSEAISHFEKTKPKGEFTLLFQNLK